MMKSPVRFYTAFSGIFLLLQGTSTLTFRLVPALDKLFPPLLAVTQMIPPHSILHIITGLLAIGVLAWGGEPGAFWFAAGFGLFYTILALFVHPSILGLQPFDHPFHFVVGGWGLIAAVLYYRSHNRKQGSA